MSDIRFNSWKHQSGTGGVHQDSSGNIGIGTTVPTTALDVAGAVSVSDIAGNTLLHSTGVNVGTGATIHSPGLNKLTLGTDNLERLGITSEGKIGIGQRNPHGKLHVYTDSLNTPASQNSGYNGQDFGIVVETDDGNNVGDEGNGICFTQQYAADNIDSGKVRTGAIIGFKDQLTGNFGGGLKFKVQPSGATPLKTSMMLDKSGNIGIGTESAGDKLVVHQGSDDDIIVRVNGADSTTEYAALGVGPGYASVVAGGSQTTDTSLVFMTANQGVEAGRWEISEDGILRNMESGYTYNFKRYQGTMPSMTSNTWATVANTVTIADAGLWILTFGRFSQSVTGGTQWDVTYVGGPVYLHHVNGNDGETVSVPLYHMGHAQNASGGSCQLTYRTGSTAHSSGRVQFRPNGWNYTGTTAYYKFYKIADL